MFTYKSKNEKKTSADGALANSTPMNKDKKRNKRTNQPNQSNQSNSQTTNKIQISGDIVLPDFDLIDTMPLIDPKKSFDSKKTHGPKKSSQPKTSSAAKKPHIPIDPIDSDDSYSDSPSYITNNTKKSCDTSVDNSDSPDEQKGDIETNIKKIHKCTTKSDALKYMSSLNDPNMKLFSEDWGTKGAKRYMVVSYDDMYGIVKDKNMHCYENYEGNVPVKLMIDIDYKIKNDMKDDDKKEDTNNTTDEIADEKYIILAKSTNIVIKMLKNYIKDDIIPKIIILSGCRDDKISFHVIFTNIHFETIKHMKTFMSDVINSTGTKGIYQGKNAIDLSIYKIGCLRMIWNSKLLPTNICHNLEYYDDDNYAQYITIKNIIYEYTDDKTLFLDSLVTNISQDSSLVDIMIEEDRVKAKKKKRNNITNINVANDKKAKPLEMLRDLLNIIDKNRFDDYDQWIQIGMAIHNYDQSTEAMQLWDEYSKKSPKYFGIDEIKQKWLSFNIDQSKCFTIATIRYFAKIDNPDEYMKTCIKYQPIEKDNFEPFIVNTNYLTDRKYRVTEKYEDDYDYVNNPTDTSKIDCVVTKKIVEWYENDEYKALGIKSEYGTGKTSLIEDVITRYNPTKILFLSYRRSLTNKLKSSFRKYFVESYLDGHYDDERTICQIESLKNVRKVYTCLFPTRGKRNPTKVVSSYDLIVIDEIESLLYHLDSSTISNRYDVFIDIKFFLQHSRKILALDADFSNRAYDFLTFFGKTMVIQNIFKHPPMNFIFTNNKKDFDAKINNDLEGGKKIVIATMSSNKGEKYVNMYSDKYKVKFYNSKSDDSNRVELGNVDRYWKNCNLVIYSPTIQTGISYDIPNSYDKLYVILCSRSCSPRAVMQMTRRVRSFNCSDVHVYLNDLPYNEKCLFYNFDDANAYINTIREEYEKKYCDRDRGFHGIDDVDVLMNLKTEICPLFDNIMTHNIVENMNKKPFQFVPSMIKLISSKGYTYKFDESVRVVDKTINYSKKHILGAENIDDVKYPSYRNKLFNADATSDEKYAIEKYLFKKAWKLNEVTDEDYEKYYDKTYILNNLRRLIAKTNNHNLPITIDSQNKKTNLSLDEKIAEIRVGYVKEFITSLGFNLNKINTDDNIVIQKEVLTQKVERCIKTCKIFTDPNAANIFGINPPSKQKGVDGKMSWKSFLGYIQSILYEYGLTLCLRQRNIWVSELKRQKKTNTYSLTYIDDLDNYV